MEPIEPGAGLYIPKSTRRIRTRLGKYIDRVQKERNDILTMVTVRWSPSRVGAACPHLKKASAKQARHQTISRLP